MKEFLGHHHFLFQKKKKKKRMFAQDVAQFFRAQRNLLLSANVPHRKLEFVWLHSLAKLKMRPNRAQRMIYPHGFELC